MSMGIAEALLTAIVAALILMAPIGLLDQSTAVPKGEAS